jgi:O-antigen ligase
MTTSTSLSGYFNVPNVGLETLARVFLVTSLFTLPLSTAATNIFMGLTLITWITAGGYRVRLEQLHGHWFAYATVMLFFIICVGSLYSTGSQSDIFFQLKKYSKILFILPAITLLQDKKWQRHALVAFGTSMLLILALSLTSVVWPLSFVLGTANGSGSSHHVFKDYIAQNLMMSFFALCLAIKAQFTTSLKHKLILFFLATLAVIDILFFVAGRTGFVSLAFNALVFIFFLPTGKQKITGVFVIIFLVSLTLLFSANFNNRISSAVAEFKSQDKKEFTSVGQRVEFLKKSIQLIKEKPLLGFGTGSYAKEFCRVADSAAWCEAGKFHPHNQFIAFMVQLGTVGFTAYLAFIAAAIKSAANQTRPLQICSVGLIATLIADSITHAPLFLASEAHFFVLLLATLLSYKNTITPEDKKLNSFRKSYTAAGT